MNARVNAPVSAPCPVVGFCAHSGTGKTTLLVKLLQILTARGLRVGVIKHAHHNFDTDRPGKDSYEIRRAGARRTLVSSRQRWALIQEHGDSDREASLEELLAIIAHRTLDLVVVEGFKREAFPKIELHRKELGKPLLCRDDDNVIALATNDENIGDVGIPVIALDEPAAVADFIGARFGLRQARP